MVNRFFLSVQAGKKLIVKGLMSLDEIRKAMMENTVVIISGTTNAELAIAMLEQLGDTEGFDPRGFMRGVSLPAGVKRNVEFTADVIIKEGKWIKGATIFDVVEDLKPGDIIFKGANAVHLPTREAAVLCGSPVLGTLGASLIPVIGKGVRMINPVGLEKRVELPILDLVRLCNQEGKGPRLCAAPGEVYTEIEALWDLYGVDAEILAAGGVGGGEGGIWFAAEGSEEQLAALAEGIREIEKAPMFVL